MLPLWIATLSLAGAVAPAPAPSVGCEHVAERNATVPAGGAELLRVAAAAGDLRVVGTPGLTEVRVRGRACASHERYLADIELVAERVGDEVRVEVRMPEMRGIGFFEARLDLVLEVPASLAADVRDSSGDAELRDLASLRVEDGSGGLRIENVAGDVTVEDGSGDLTVRRVGGDLRLSDSSGEITVDGVEGSVLVEDDDSGDMGIDNVRRDVVVRRDSSGGISVSRIGGDFRVERDGSGGIRHREVAGAVAIPRRR